jgi:hypothetical protein
VNARKIGTTLRVTPDVVRIDVPLRHADDLPQLARELEQLAFQLRATHQADHLFNDNGKVSEAYAHLRAFKIKLNREYPR